MSLTPKIADWVTQQVGEIIQSAQLAGSTTTTLYRIESSNARYVLRLYDNQVWLKNEPDLCEHEASALQIAQSAEIATPELIAYEPDPSIAGVGVLLMSHLEGIVWLKPSNMNDWLKQSAEALATIHRLKPTDFGWQHYRYVHQHQLKVPSWTKQPKTWQHLIEHIQLPEPDTPTHFIHRDYHQTNFLWKDGKLTGVVDWINACLGVADVDIGHMRLNLARLYGLEIADGFLRAYQRANPNYRYNPYWDAMALADGTLDYDTPPRIYRPWLDFGITEISDEQVQQGTEELAKSIEARI